MIADYEDDIVAPYATFRVAGSQESEVCARRDSAIAQTIGNHQSMQMNPINAHGGHHTLGHNHRNASASIAGGSAVENRERHDSAQYELLVTHVISR